MSEKTQENIPESIPKTLPENILTTALKGCDEKTEIAIFTHKFPDPDAIASMMLLKWIILKTTKVKVVDLLYEGKISHPQNQVMDNLLEPGLKKVTELLLTENYANNYAKNFLVDTVPSIAGTNNIPTEFDLVIDHHKEPSETPQYLYHNEHSGSCASTLYKLAQDLGLEFDADSEVDRRVATAVLVGIATDTDILCGQETTTTDVNAWSDLLEKRDASCLARILNFARPRFWVEKRAQVVPDAIKHIQEGVVIVGIGRLDDKHRDLIADIATDISNWEEVHTAIVFALLDGSRIEGSVRSANTSISVPNLCKELGKSKEGTGGGKPGKGAYKYHLGGAKIDLGEDEQIAEDTWTLFDLKERKRVMKVIRNL